ncbi:MULTISPECIES: hypothetical protein [unclassified Microcoleus]|uniref:hypothetical protein n=1 Tax=unclassified Microcoleus TaxID=2642155 RepID=UPI002FCE8D34
MTILEVAGLTKPQSASENSHGLGRMQRSPPSAKFSLKLPSIEILTPKFYDFYQQAWIMKIVQDILRSLPGTDKHKNVI